MNEEQKKKGKVRKAQKGVFSFEMVISKIVIVLCSFFERQGSYM